MKKKPQKINKKTTKILSKSNTKKNNKKTNNIKDPLNGVLEKDFLEAIDNITKNLAYKFKFGYHGIDDMKQQIMLFALEGIKNYDHVRPLENFLWTHVRNRLFNYKRDHYQRPNKPCLSCPFYDAMQKNSLSGCTKFEDKKDCELYLGWFTRNNIKKNLVHFNPIEDIKDYANFFQQNSPDQSSSLTSKETLEAIENILTGELREIYLKLKNGCKVNKSDRNKLLTFLRENINYE